MHMQKQKFAAGRHLAISGICAGAAAARPGGGSRGEADAAHEAHDVRAHNGRILALHQQLSLKSPWGKRLKCARGLLYKARVQQGIGSQLSMATDTSRQQGLWAHLQQGAQVALHPGLQPLHAPLRAVHTLRRRRAAQRGVVCAHAQSSRAQLSTHPTHLLA